MRKKKLFMLLALVLCATAVIFICGCQDKSKPGSTAAASAAITDSGDNEITTVAATKTTKKSSTTKKKNTIRKLLGNLSTCTVCRISLTF